MTMNSVNESLNAENITISCGIAQDGSLSTLIFSLALMPLSKFLDHVQYDYKTFDKHIIISFTCMF